MFGNYGLILLDLFLQSDQKSTWQKQEQVGDHMTRAPYVKLVE